MLKKLISTVFHQHDPTQFIQDQLASNWSEWLCPISEEKPAGEDPIYTDNFQTIKEEIGKLGGFDVDRVVQLSEELLKTTSKDIRVVTYYCWARMKLHGLLGFIDGIELLAGLLSTFGDALYPSREPVRKNSIEWLASAKFTESLNVVFPIDTALLERMTAALNLIIECNRILFDENNVPDLDGLIRFFTYTITETPTPTPKENPRVNPAPVLQDEKRSEKAIIPLMSQRDVLDQTRRIATFLREKPDGYLSSGRMIRSIRWDTVLMLPPADIQKRTRLPAPRLELKNHIQRLFQQQQWEDVLEKVEMAFMESANHFWLDLQRYAITAMQKRNTQFAAWADIFLTDVGLVLDRLQGLEQLKFDNGMPFADEDTLCWIRSSATIHHVDTDIAIPAYIAKTTEPINWTEIEYQAIVMAHDEGLENAVNWLQNLSDISSPKQHFLLRYTQARVADRVGQKDAALCLFQGLNNKESEISLSQWDMELWFDIKAQLLALLNYKIQRKEGDKTALIKQVDNLHHELMQLNPARAIRVSLS